MEKVVEVNSILMTWFLYSLVLIRCSGIAVFAPFFGSEFFPVRVRIGMAVFFAILMMPAATATMSIPATIHMPELTLLAAQELTMGLVIGFFSSLVFMGTQLAGQLVGQQIGFAMANILDPISGQDISLIGFLNMNLAVLIFLVAKLHLLIVVILWQSYKWVGIGTLALKPFMEVMGDASLMEVHQLYIVGLQLSMPVLLVMLLNSVVEGFVTRTMPQMNIMVLGLPLRVVMGITAVMFIMPSFCAALSDPSWVFNTEQPPDGILGSMIWRVSEMVKALGR